MVVVTLVGSFLLQLLLPLKVVVRRRHFDYLISDIGTTTSNAVPVCMYLHKGVLSASTGTSTAVVRAYAFVSRVMIEVDESRHNSKSYTVLTGTALSTTIMKQGNIVSRLFLKASSFIRYGLFTQALSIHNHPLTWAVWDPPAHILNLVTVDASIPERVTAGDAQSLTVTPFLSIFLD
jgi:hypothetical protein